MIVGRPVRVLRGGLRCIVLIWRAGSRIGHLGGRLSRQRPDRLLMLQVLRGGLQGLLALRRQRSRGSEARRLARAARPRKEVLNQAIGRSARVFKFGRL